jgi:branched-chain amino acid aminotransferase
MDPIRIYRLAAAGLEPVRLEPPPASLDDASRRLPQGAYTTFRTLAGRTKAPRLTAHLRRLEQSSIGLGVDFGSNELDQAAIRSALRVVLAELAPNEVRVRLGVDAELCPGQVYLLLEPLSLPPDSAYRDGVHLATSALHRDHPELKSTGFIAPSRDERAGRPAEIYELLLLGPNGEILEGASSNFFAVQDGVLRTAEQDVLAGVTRAILLDLAQREAIPIDLTPVRLAALPDLSETFITSSTRGVVPAVKIDNCRIGDGRPGPLTRRLMAAYQKRLEAEAELI